MLPLECIVRGYVSGSAWKEYRKDGDRSTGWPCRPGSARATGCRRRSSPPPPRRLEGHDENISFSAAATSSARRRPGPPVSCAWPPTSRAPAWAEERGIIIADTKFELGWIDGQLAICDEILTPDSSRFWPADQWEPGSTPPSLDKQPVRDWLEGTGWDKTPPPPALPADIVSATRAPLRRRLRAADGAVLRRVAGRRRRLRVMRFDVLVEVRSVRGSPTQRGRPSNGRCRRSDSRLSTRCRSGRRSASGSTPRRWRTPRPSPADLADRLLANPVIEVARVSVAGASVAGGSVAGASPAAGVDEAGGARLPSPLTSPAGRDGAGGSASSCTPGSNCEHDVVEAVTALGAEADLVWHTATDLGRLRRGHPSRRLRPR